MFIVFPLVNGRTWACCRDVGVSHSCRRRLDTVRVDRSHLATDRVCRFDGKAFWRRAFSMG